MTNSLKRIQQKFKKFMINYLTKIRKDLYFGLF